MNALRKLCSLVLASSALPSSGVPALPPQPNELQQLVSGNTSFALDLYGQLKTRPGNLFFSPYSVSTCLAMAYAGARGDTEKQMAQVLHLGPDQDRVHAAFVDLQRQLNEAEKQKGIQIHIANALWAQQGHPLLPDFLKIAQGDYRANINQADFKTGAEKARNEINGWVAQKTQDKIQDLLPPGSLDAMTRLVLANAIYFKGIWANPFEKAKTTTQPFHLAAGGQVNAALMHHFDSVGYMETNDFQAVELPYSGGALSTVILLPRQVQGCGQLENQLSPALLADTLGRMHRQRVELFLPRFKMASEFELNRPLETMGMQDAFGATADFSAMDGTRLLYISAVFHKAWVQVNEEGTEAAAATGATIALLGAIEEPPVFRADHPFIFLIRETRSGSLLFLGRVADPTR